MRNLKMIVQYEGTNYCGFQRQYNGITVQEVLEEKLFVVTKENIILNASGRTDAGVHAKGQVVNFLTHSAIPTDRVALALNSMLPSDIAVQKVEEVPLDFHSRYSAKSKVYTYNILNSPVPSPFLSRYAYFFPRILNLAGMLEGAAYLLGKHDFSSFRSAGSSVRSSIRHVYRLEIRQGQEGLIELEIEANGFLYNMVRIIVGTLIQVGTGKITPQDIQRILEEKDRKMAGQTAPAKGLFLKEVKYFD